MTEATTEGRRLRLTVEGIEEPFLVDPLPAKRGHALTVQFVEAAAGRASVGLTEAVFIEAFGAANYSRMSGLYVDRFDPTTGEHVETYGPTGPIEPAHPREPLPAEVVGLRFLAREADGEPELDGDPIRQEEGEALTLCAFYWQTVVGMEAVRAFLDEGEGTAGSVKALGLLLSRSGLSRSQTSRRSVSASPTEQAATPGTSTRSGGSISGTPHVARLAPPHEPDAIPEGTWFRRSPSRENPS